MKHKFAIVYNVNPPEATKLIVDNLPKEENLVLVDASKYGDFSDWHENELALNEIRAFIKQAENAGSSEEMLKLFEKYWAEQLKGVPPSFLKISNAAKFHRELVAYKKLRPASFLKILQRGIAFVNNTKNQHFLETKVFSRIKKDTPDLIFDLAGIRELVGRTFCTKIQVRNTRQLVKRKRGAIEGAINRNQQHFTADKSSNDSTVLIIFPWAYLENPESPIVRQHREFNLLCGVLRPSSFIEINPKSRYAQEKAAEHAAAFAKFLRDVDELL